MPTTIARYGRPKGTGVDDSRQLESLAALLAATLHGRGLEQFQQRRRHLRRLTERALPHLVVLSYAELPADVSVRAIATVEDARAPQAV